MHLPIYPAGNDKCYATVETFCTLETTDSVIPQPGVFRFAIVNEYENISVQADKLCDFARLRLSCPKRNLITMEQIIGKVASYRKPDTDFFLVTDSFTGGQL